MPLSASSRPSLRALVVLVTTLAACGGKIVNDNGGDNGGNGGHDSDGAIPDIGLSADSYAFGELSYGSRDSTAITVYNHGDGTLNVTSVAVDEPFSVTPTSFTVRPGGNTTVTITFTANVYGEQAGDVAISSDDPDTPEAAIQVTGLTLADEDEDGHDVVAAGGDDCDDTNPAVYPGAPETWYDGIDQDCLGDDDFDQDRDGWQADAYNADPTRGGGDCQDTDPAYNPGATDTPYDNQDTNCDGADDYDADGDGFQVDTFGSGSDCDDSDPDINPDGEETLDALDNDCEDGADDWVLAARAPYQYEAGGNRDRVGYAVAMGDLDGDGDAELLIGAPYVDASSNNTAGKGGFGIVEGGPGLAASGTDIDAADQYFEGGGATDLLGWSVSVVGDYDGDDVPEVALGAPGVSSNAGAVYLLDGADLLAGRDLGSALFTLTGPAAGQLGVGLGSELDLDGDGLHELVAVYRESSADGIAIRYGGTGTDDVAVGDVTTLILDGADHDSFGDNGLLGGDFDGDGYTDLPIANATWDVNGENSGAVFVLWGGAERLASGPGYVDELATRVLTGDAAGDGLGTAASFAPDWNGDDHHAAELWVHRSGDGLYVIEGGPSRRAAFSLDDAAVYYDWHTNSEDVDRIHLAGDWTGDGVSDVFVHSLDQAGSYGELELFSSEVQEGTYYERDGRIAWVTGSASGDNADVGFGLAPIAGDADGDGRTDALVGDPGFQSVKGRAYLFINRLGD